MNIGGDTPGCGMGVPTPDTACADILPAVVVPIDGKSGTPSVAGLTEENSGVYRKYLHPILHNINPLSRWEYFHFRRK